MKQSLCRFIYYRLLGWKTEVTVPHFDKCIYCIAPHTSNLDLFLGKLVLSAIGWESGFMMKKEWFFFPLGPLFRAMGGIPIERQKHTSTVDAVIRLVLKSKTFHLAITPEGTRSANPNWKKGFYYIALGAGIPIVLAGFDFGKKTVIATKYLYPSGDSERDMRDIKLYFRDMRGRHPEKFTVGLLRDEDTFRDGIERR